MWAKKSRFGGNEWCCRMPVPLHLVCFCPEWAQKMVGVGCDGGRDRKKRKGQRGQGEKEKEWEERFSQKEMSEELYDVSQRKVTREFTFLIDDKKKVLTECCQIVAVVKIVAESDLFLQRLVLLCIIQQLSNSKPLSKAQILMHARWPYSTPQKSTLSSCVLLLRFVIK